MMLLFAVKFPIGVKEVFHRWEDWEDGLFLKLGYNSLYCTDWCYWLQKAENKICGFSFCLVSETLRAGCLARLF